MRPHQVLRIVLAALAVAGSSFGQQASLASLPAGSEPNTSGAVVVSTPVTHDETGFFNSWQSRVRDTLAQPPS
jgi:hypothetical protein